VSRHDRTVAGNTYNRPVTCPNCQDLRWACEHHADHPPNHDGCDGPAIRCPDCQPPGGQTDLPDGWISIDAIAQSLLADDDDAT
jgi:hypothetical protein